MEPIEFRYRPGVFKMLIVLLPLAALSHGMGQLALTNDRGLVLNHILHFSPNGATILYWLITALFAALMVFPLMGIFSSLSDRGFLRLTETELHVPQGLWLTNHKIPYGSIYRVALLRTDRYSCLQIMYENKQADINPSWLPTGAFDQVCKVITERTNPGRKAF
jgi:hypothetical protein